MSKRPEHYAEYADSTEIVPGVFVDPGDAVYIVDDIGEVASWNADEWAEDPEAVTATINACIVATKYGPAAVRKNIENKGATLMSLIESTFAINEGL